MESMEPITSARDIVISVRHLTKIYRVGAERVVALSDINFDICLGQVVCIVGTSGSGKSTLLNQLAGLEKPTAGQVIIGKRVISSFTENQLAKFRQRYIGFVFQSYNLMPAMTALENVQMPMIFRGVDKKDRNKAAKRILKDVGLGDRMRHKPSQMSGGQQQRVGIARAFVATPKIIFADEPTGNLDTRTTIEVMRMMVRLCRENAQTLIIVTHDAEIAEYADRIITIRDGVLTDDRLNHSLADRPADEQAILDREAQSPTGIGQPLEMPAGQPGAPGAGIPAPTFTATPAPPAVPPPPAGPFVYRPGQGAPDYAAPWAPPKQPAPEPPKGGGQDAPQQPDQTQEQRSGQ